MSDCLVADSIHCFRSAEFGNAFDPAATLSYNHSQAGSFQVGPPPSP